MVLNKQAKVVLAVLAVFAVAISAVLFTSDMGEHEHYDSSVSLLRFPHPFEPFSGDIVFAVYDDYVASNQTVTIFVSNVSENRGRTLYTDGGFTLVKQVEDEWRIVFQHTGHDDDAPLALGDMQRLWIRPGRFNLLEVDPNKLPDAVLLNGEFAPGTYRVAAWMYFGSPPSGNIMAWTEFVIS